MLLLLKTILCSVTLSHYKLKNKKKINQINQIKFVKNPIRRRDAIVYLSWYDQTWDLCNNKFY